MNDEADAWLAQMKDWMDRDDMIRRVVISCLEHADCPDTRHLLELHPTTFENLYEAIETMVEDVPIHNPPGFSR